MPAWSIITVTYNSSLKLGTYWKSERPANVEWIVVDNASTDDTVAVATRLGAHVISLDENVGFSAANNIGLAKATGTYVAFVNPDAAVAYETLDDLGRVADTSGGLVAPQLVNDDLTLQPNGRGIPRIISKVNNRLGFSKRLSAEYTLYTEGTEVKNVFWVTGAAVCARREVFDHLRGWNEKYFLYYEDLDMSCRAHISGYPVVVYGGAKWVHGWARDTATWKLGPWMHELRSAWKFYKSYPALINGLFIRYSRFAEVHKRSDIAWAEGR